MQDFEAASANLDDNGWSRDDVVYPATRQRFGLLLSPIREEALELTNGPATLELEMRAKYAFRSRTASEHLP